MHNSNNAINKPCNMKTFQNLAQFKSLLNVGVNVKCTYHKNFVGRGEDNKPVFTDKDMGIREITIKQSNSFALRTIKTDGTIINSWCAYPKASECKITNNNTTLVIYEDDNLPVLSYSFPD